MTVGHQGQDSRSVPCDQLYEFTWIRHGIGGDRRTVVQRLQRQSHPHRMEQRQDGQHDIGRLVPKRWLQMLTQTKEEIALMGQLYSLGLACGTRGVHQDRGLPRIDGNRRVNSRYGGCHLVELG